MPRLVLSQGAHRRAPLLPDAFQQRQRVGGEGLGDFVALQAGAGGDYSGEGLGEQVVGGVGIGVEQEAGATAPATPLRFSLGG